MAAPREFRRLWQLALAARLSQAALVGDPARLCPEAHMPPEWHERCLHGNLLYGRTGDVNSRLLPEVGNGYLARKVKSPAIFAAGLYNGDDKGSDGPSSYRARLPPYNAWVKVDNKPEQEHASTAGGSGCALDVERAVFMQRSHDPLDGHGVQVDQAWYAPLHEPSVLVHEITLRNRARVRRTLRMGQWGSVDSPSLLTRLMPRERLALHGLTPSDTHAIEGTSRVGELGNRTAFALVANRVPDSVDVPPGTKVTVYALTAVVTSLNSTDPTRDALETLRRYTQGGFAAMPSMLDAHVGAWQRRWREGRIEVDGDLALAQVVNSSLYFIRSSIREDWPHGLSPGGLASNAYSGHSFWDMETWMFPPLLMLEPRSARSLLRYRFDRREQARLKARACGDPHQSYCPPGYQQRLAPEALMFPWESAHTGADVQYWGGKLGPWGRYEQHISGDIALAARQYWYATHDREWLRSEGLPLANGTASFYVARVEWRPRTDAFDFRRVMGPDEYSWPVDNSGYTNAVARIALGFAAESAAELGHSGRVYDDFLYKAEGLALPAWSGTPPGRPELVGGYHPEYQHFPKDPHHPRAKQADAILLAYPLGAVDEDRMAANDLEFYEPITDPTGPAMTWSMFAIGWFGVGNFERSAPHFLKGFHNAQPPFGVWTEYPQGAKSFPGCINFITGAGGFLQSIVYGTSGMRIKRDGLHLNPPPPHATGTKAWRFTLHSFHYRGWRLRQEVTRDEVAYEVLAGQGPRLCLAAQGGSPAEMRVGQRVVHRRGTPARLAVCQRHEWTQRLLSESTDILV
mmetsp:Transcript_18795/g.59106  ORF Transcript_18795/g.59106 Transcript_18795/m.59106 type:complete len:802 (-) Transcript_18795:411-2816(-)